MQSYRNGAYKHHDAGDCEHECLALLYIKVAVSRSHPISRSALSTMVAKRRIPQELGTPVCVHARNAVCLLWLQLHSRNGHRPIPVFAGQFPSFSDNSGTDRRLVLDGFFVLGPPVFFAECIILHSKWIPQNPFAWGKFS